MLRRLNLQLHQRKSGDLTRISTLAGEYNILASCLRNQQTNCCREQHTRQLLDSAYTLASLLQQQPVVSASTQACTPASQSPCNCVMCAGMPVSRKLLSCLWNLSRMCLRCLPSCRNGVTTPAMGNLYGQPSSFQWSVPPSFTVVYHCIMH